ncbi:MAG: bifunctional (p)ppGpp synthetase/guanosine-3',5'-bis(diphosphate) 3'-pyrophosphohydrolase [bacterium]
MITFNDLKDKIRDYEPAADFTLLECAYNLAARYYNGNKAVHGKNLLQHCLQVAVILADLRIDLKTIIGGLLHEIMPYCKDDKDLAAALGDEIAAMVRLLASVNIIQFSSDEEEQAGYIRRMFVALARDTRVVLVKLAGRLDVMRNLDDSIPAEVSNRLARETLQLYSPIAHRLGVYQIKSELEDHAFHTLHPEQYNHLRRLADERKEERQIALNGITAQLKDIFKDAGFSVHITGRTKNLYSTYQKMVRLQKDFSEIYDLTAVRIIVEKVEECYNILGILHSIWKPIPDTFDDYIMNKKPNGYQSLHTVVVTPNGEHVEIQIRTWEMHMLAEYGVAAHWRYKEKDAARRAEDEPDAFIHRMPLREEIVDSKEFIESIILDRQEEHIFAFTPKGKIISLPRGATPIDFAYRVHTDIGHRCRGARVNGQMVPLDYVLHNGDVVEVITGRTLRPSRDWLTFIASPTARSKIKQWFKKEEREENITHGKAMIAREMQRQGLRRKDILENITYDDIVAEMQLQTEDDLFAGVGCGDISAQAVVNRIKRIYKEKVREEEEKKPVRAAAPRRQVRPGVLVDGIPGILVNIARCCFPVPGDDIIGFVSRGRGLSIHTRDCPNIRRSLDAGDRIISVSWDSIDEKFYITELELRALDRVGILNDITNAISSAGINIIEMKGKSLKDSTALFNLKLEVQNREKLNSLIHLLNSMDDVIFVKRTGAKSKGGRT